MQQKEIDSRRKARQKRARRKRLKICFIFFLIASLITLAIMSFTVFFPIKRISVSGSQIYSKAEIIKASGLSTDDNLFVVSEEKIEQSIRKKLPYIDSVSLKRNLPDAVVLTVKDAKEYSCIEVAQKYYIISQSGYVLKEQSESPENVFKIITSGAKCEIAKMVEYKSQVESELVATMVQLLENKGINIDSVDVSSALNLTVNVEDKFVVKMGTDEFLEQKIAHLRSMIDSIGDRKGEINLSMWTPNNSQGSFVEDTN